MLEADEERSSNRARDVRRCVTVVVVVVMSVCGRRRWVVMEWLVVRAELKLDREKRQLPG